MTIENNKYERGSEWRKWDLHIHSPFTHSTSNRYKTENLSVEEFCNIIIQKEIKVIGLTNYFFITENEFNTICEKLKDKCFVIPNFEFRASDKNKKSDFINFHVLFNPKIKIKDILISLSKVPLHSDDKKYCCEKDILEIGIEAVTVDFDSMLKQLSKDFNLFDDFIVSVPYNGHGGFKPDLKPRNIKIALKYENKSHFIYGNKTITNYFLNERTYQINDVISKIRTEKAVIQTSDAHSKDEISEKYTWIKSDPTFEGLKQIIFEPELRVSLNTDNPEKKSNYQVIDRLEINYKNIFNKSIKLNSYLNSIIGGRSTGKSILLASIAKKIKTDEPVTFENKKRYDSFINEISESLKIHWKDGVENNDREVEYFHQGYMYDIARDDNKKDRLIQKILKNKGKESILYNYEKSISENKKKISNLVNDFFQLRNEINEKELKVRDKGDKKGIEDEIKRLNVELKKLSAIKINDEEKRQYDLLKEKIDKSNQQKTSIEQDLKIINSLIDASLIKDSISYDITSISEINKSSIETIFKSLKDEFTLKWKSEIIKQTTLIKGKLISIISELDIIQKNTTYIKVSTAFAESTQFSELDTKITKEKKKLYEITSILAEIKGLEKQNISNKENLKLCFNDFFVKSDEIINKLSDSVDDLKIKSKSILQSDKCYNFLKSSLNQNNKNNQIYLSGAYAAMEKPTISTFVFQIFEALISNKLKLKGEFNKRNFSNNLLSENYYKISYDLIYDGDNFELMSEGKKAFVVLKLLLDFSNKECPILIDQPEDDLDNRTIYTELAKYLRKKKIERQIILVTHNPNIVVGADSELVIVANQHGIKNKNTDESKKFQYVTGSIENTCKKNNEIKSILDSQGIREHVCEILEGGNEAFKQRERKYSIK